MKKSVAPPSLSYSDLLSSASSNPKLTNEMQLVLRSRSQSMYDAHLCRHILTYRCL